MKTKFKHLALILLLSVYATANAVTYTWNGGATGRWDTSTNWTPIRTTPATTDDLIFTQAVPTTITNITTPQTINSLTINGSSSVTFSGTPLITFVSGGSINIAAGNTLDMGTARMFLSDITTGTLTTSGTGALITAATSALPSTAAGTGITFTFDVTFNGIALQTIPRAVFNNFTLNNTVAIGSIAANIAGGDVTINGNLTLSKGILACGTSTGRNLNLVSTATLIGGSSASYIYTANGTFNRKNVGTSTLLYPIGTLTSYAPLTITNSIGTPNITTKLKSTFTNAPADLTKVVNLEWSVLSSVATTADIIYQFNAADFASAYSVGSTSELGNFKTTYTVSSVGTPSGSDPYIVSATGLSIPTSGSNLFVIGNTNKILGGTTSLVEEIKDSFDFEVTNSGDFFLMNYSIPSETFVNVRLMNLNGQTLQSLLLGKQQKGQVVISSSHLSKGLYLVTLQIDGNIVTKKVVKY